MKFVKNVWYVAEWANRLAIGTLLARRILNEPVVLFRNSDGVTALLDRCPHRFAPLSKGRITERGLQCGYHGLEFGSSGVCIGNPHGTVPRNGCARAFPAIERHGLIWIWMGEPAKANPELIPDFSFIPQSNPVTVLTGYMMTKTHYEIYNDNLLDLSHIDYLHPTTLGSGAVTTSQAEVSQSADNMHVRWWSPDVKAPEMYDRYLEKPGAQVDSCLEMTWYPVGCMELTASLAMAGTPLQDGIRSRNAHFLTPETDSSTHYFYFSTRNFSINQEATNARIDMVKLAFEQEDRPMLEAVFERMGTPDLMGLKPILLSTDAAAVRARRIVQSILERERDKTAPEVTSATH